MTVSWRVRGATDRPPTVPRVRSRTDAREAALLVAVAGVVGVLVVMARTVGLPDAAPGTALPPGASPWVLAAAGLAASALQRSRTVLPDGWATWRRVLGLLALACLAYPGLWAVAVIASAVAPGSVLAWVPALLATTAHVPLLAAFSVLPLLAARYLGRGVPVLPLAVVGVSAVLAVLAFGLFFDDHAPLRVGVPVRWEHGDAVGGGFHALFLATVLLGPLTAARAAWRSDGEAARRLALVTASSLAGAALVLGCGAAGALGGLGALLVLTAMPVAVAVVAIGCTTALTTDLPLGPVTDETTATSVSRSLQPALDAHDGATRVRLTPREGEVVALLAQGLSNAGIAARLVVSERTVDAHLRSAFVKLDLPEGPEQNRRVHAVLAWQGRASDPG
jgi:DNA-binding NarL/FixJ family response regulator